MTIRLFAFGDEYPEGSWENFSKLLGLFQEFVGKTIEGPLYVLNFSVYDHKGCLFSMSGDDSPDNVLHLVFEIPKKPDDEFTRLRVFRSMTEQLSQTISQLNSELDDLGQPEIREFPGLLTIRVTCVPKSLDALVTKLRREALVAINKVSENV